MANKKITNTGLLNLSALLRQAKKKHSAYWKKENGDIVCWVNQIESDEPDQHGQTSTIMLNGKKEFRETEKSNDNFICNMKPNTRAEGEITDKDVNNLPKNDDVFL